MEQEFKDLESVGWRWIKLTDSKLYFFPPFSVSASKMKSVIWIQIDSEKLIPHFIYEAITY